MENLILIVDAPISVHDVAAVLSDHFEVAAVEDDRYLVEDGDAHLWIDGWSEMGVEYPTRPSGTERFRSPTLVAINYSRGTAFARAIAAVATRQLDCIVDTDHGLVVDGDVFAALLEEHHPTWDWRTTADPRADP
jgi:hypothetical protein